MNAEPGTPTDLVDTDAGMVGYFTWDQFEKLRRAWTDALKHVSWWKIAGHLRSGDPDEHHARMGGPSIPIPATWLAADWISTLMGELNRWDRLEDAVADMDGYWFADQFTREVQTAMAKWPMADKPHRVQFFRCMACDQATLTYYPPNFNGDEIRPVAVKCRNKECRAVMDELMFSRMAAVIEAEWKERSERRDRRVDSGTQSAGEVRPVAEDDLPVGERGSGADDATREDALAVRP